MKKPVEDAVVAEYTKRLRSGGPVGAAFPYPLSECDFSEAQKFLIKEARKAREKLLKNSKPQPATHPQSHPKTTALKPIAPQPSQPKAIASMPATPVRPLAPKYQSPTKLEKMLYLQQGKCFFCGEKLALTDTNIEHLHPLSKGGKRTEDNEVVCHKSLNDTFGNLPLKQKFEFVLKAAGSFRCPKK
jgi:5-methylcytosine-specific restriction endonuclease McrA